MPIDSPTTSARAWGHHSATSFQTGPKLSGTIENGAPGIASGSLCIGTPKRSATAAPSRLWSK